MLAERKRVCVICGELRPAIVSKSFPTVIGCEPCSNAGLRNYIIPSGVSNKAALEINEHLEKLENELTSGRGSRKLKEFDDR